MTLIPTFLAGAPTNAVMRQELNAGSLRGDHKKQGWGGRESKKEMHAKMKTLNLLTVNVCPSCLHFVSVITVVTKVISTWWTIFSPHLLASSDPTFSFFYLYHFLSSNVRNHVNVDFMLISLDGFLVED